MKTKTKIIFNALLVGLILSSCNSAPTESNTEVKDSIKVESVENHGHEHEHEHQEAIELDNGSKWKVDPEMMRYIRNMEKDILQFATSNHNEISAFKQLGASLKKNVDGLTSSCTMKGKAHDELHKWLLPYIDLVDSLNKSEDVTAAQNVLSEIQVSITEFNKFFE